MTPQDRMVFALVFLLLAAYGHGKKTTATPVGETQRQESLVNSEQQESLTNSELQESRENSEQQELLANSEQQESQENSEQQESQENSEQQESQENSEQQESQENSEQQESQEISEEQESQENSKQQESQEISKQQESQENSEQQESQENSEQQESQEISDQQESQEISEQQESQENNEQQESQEISDQQESQEISEQQESKENSGQQESQENSEQRESQENSEQQESQENSEQQESQENSEQQESQENNEQQESQENNDQQESQEISEQQESKENTGQQESQENSEQRESQENSEQQDSRENSEQQESQENSEQQESQKNNEQQESQENSEQQESQENSEQQESQENSEDPLASYYWVLRFFYESRILTICYTEPWVPDLPWTSEGGSCLLAGNIADCSRHGGTLTYVPNLPLGVSHLNFSRNGVVTLSSDFFSNATGITHLDLSSNELENISNDAFWSLRNLTFLDLSDNFLTYDELLPVFSLATLKKLVLRSNGIGPLPGGVFYSLPPQLESLCLMDNFINAIDMAAFKQLKMLDLGANQLVTESLALSPSPELRYLNLMINNLRFFPDTCDDDNVSLFPQLGHLALQVNYILVIPSKVCLPNVQLITLGDNLMLEIKTDAFGGRFFPSLELLNLQTMRETIQVIEGSAFRNTSIIYLYLSDNSIDFSAESIDAGMFDGCPRLEVLYLNGNDFSKVSDGKLSRLLSPLNASLTELCLNSCKIGWLGPLAFANLTQLRLLLLSSNKLTELGDGVFNSFTNLNLITLNKNRISVIRESVFSGITHVYQDMPDHPHLPMVDLCDNPFWCSCELRWFQQWLQTGQNLVSDPYMCDNIPNTRVDDFYVADQSCLLSPEASKFIIATIVMILCSMTLVTLLYRYRWHIRLVLYEAFRGQGDRQRRFREQRFQYDVFVSFDSEDMGWVRAHLMPELEVGMGLRLCIHERDFTPGRHIVDNIDSCVQKSKKVMMIFSTNFANSPWCQFELNLCLSHVLENDDMLLVVMLHDIPSRDLTPAMMAVMKNTTYIEWGDEPEARASFWRRIYIALDEVLPAV